MRVLACLLLVACGGGDDPVEGVLLLQTTLAGQHDNHPWTPMYGFGRADGASFELFVGQQDLACDDTLEGRPRPGNYGQTSVSAPPVVGTYAAQGYSLVEVDGNKVDINAGTGSVMITAVTDTQISAVLAYSATIGAGQFSLTGAVTMARCP